MEDGRTRLTILDRHILNDETSNLVLGSKFAFFTNRVNPSTYREAWLSQAIHVFHVLGIPREEWEDYTLSATSCIYVSPDYSGHAQARQSDIQFDPPIYLFVLPPPRQPVHVAFWSQASTESLCYWSVDPDGNRKLSEAQRMALGLPCFQRSQLLPWNSGRWEIEVYDVMRRWQEAKGFDPTTTDFAQSMGHPILEIIPQDEARFETCQENVEHVGNQKHEQGSEPMQVDEFSETIPDPQASPASSRQGLVDSSLMDIDMEDCNGRMADLSVDTISIDV
ncbi:hypothetical protein PM082_016960 [Marasmius tenuissimus]|nr:hypothetical protein PM082_016960 [Marasmius tenuissimus]